MTIISEIVLFLRDVLLAIMDILTGRKRRRYEHAVAINAPIETVWQMLRSRDITFEGLIPMRVTTTPSLERPNFERGRIVIGDREMLLASRIIQERPERVLLMEILPEGTDPAIITGKDDFLGFVLEATPAGTIMSMTREVSPNWLTSFITVPLGLRSGARRYKKTAEAMAAGKPTAHAAISADRTASTTEAEKSNAGSSSSPNVPPPSGASPLARSSFGLTPNGILFSVLAFASFAYLWGFRDAVLLAVIIILHELGHALAMLIVGIPVKGIYLVPFFGGAAIAAAPYRNEGQIGFVALMGPAFSLVPTLAFASLAWLTGEAIVSRAVELSAIINLLNLVPIMPLDGGQVLKAALVSMNRTLAMLAGLIGAGLGLWAAYAMRDPIIGVFFLLGLLVTLQLRKASPHQPMHWSVALALLFAMLITIAAYAAILYFGAKRGALF